MSMYIFAISLFSVFAFLEVFNRDIMAKYKIIFAFICYVFFIFHDGLRWETGTDWIPYTETFENITGNFNFEGSLMEPGYLLLLYVCRTISDDYTFYLIVHAIIFYTLFFICIFKVSNYPFVSILIFYMITLPYLGMNRQFLAMAIVSLGLVFLLQGHKTYYFLCIFLGLFFHSTAILGIAAIFVNRRIPYKYLLIALAIALIISFSGVLDTVSNLSALAINQASGTRIDYYSENTGDTSLVATVLSLIKKLLWVSLLMIFDKKIENKNKEYNLAFNLYFLGCIMYVLFNGTMFQIIVSRALIYYNIMEMFIVPYVLTIFKANYGKLLIMFVLVAYCWINIQKGFDNYKVMHLDDLFVPYKGIFINTDYVRQSH